MNKEDKNVISIKTSKLQDMVSRAVKGASNNKMLPITSLMSIGLSDHKLTLITSDATNYLYIVEDKVEGDDFNITVPAEMFAKLVARMTSESVTLDFDNEKLIVTGNGTYIIELPIDENGEIIKYPDPVASIDFSKKGKGKSTEIKFAIIRKILETAKPALATTFENPCYTGYYVGDKVIATDTANVCVIDAKLLDEPALISPEMMNLLAVVDSENIEVWRKENQIAFITSDCIVFGYTMEWIADYNVTAINSLIAADFNSMCKISRQAFLQLLDRLALFVTEYDNDGIYLTFTRDGLQVTSKTSSGVEIIPYIDSKDFSEFTCCLEIAMLYAQVKAQTGESVEIWYGMDVALKMTFDNITQIVAFAEEDDRFGVGASE